MPLVISSHPLLHLAIGKNVDARDRYGKWLPASVVAMQQAEFTVHFHGWDSKYDEILPVSFQDPPRLADFGAFSGTGEGNDMQTLYPLQSTHFFLHQGNWEEGVVMKHCPHKSQQMYVHLKRSGIHYWFTPLLGEVRSVEEEVLEREARLHSLSLVLTPSPALLADATTTTTTTTTTATITRPQNSSRYTLTRPPRGIKNEGNTCYLNSVMQCLAATEPLVRVLLSSIPTNTNNNNNSNNNNNNASSSSSLAVSPIPHILSQLANEYSPGNELNKTNNNNNNNNNNSGKRRGSKPWFVELLTTPPTSSTSSSSSSSSSLTSSPPAIPERLLPLLFALHFSHTLSLLYQPLQKQIPLSQQQPPINVLSLKLLLGLRNSEFNNWHQHDAMEAVSAVIGLLDDATAPLRTETVAALEVARRNRDSDFDIIDGEDATVEKKEEEEEKEKKDCEEKPKEAGGGGGGEEEEEEFELIEKVEEGEEEKIEENNKKEEEKEKKNDVKEDNSNKPSSSSGEEKSNVENSGGGVAGGVVGGGGGALREVFASVICKSIYCTRCNQEVSRSVEEGSSVMPISLPQAKAKDKGKVTLNACLREHFMSGENCDESFKCPKCNQTGCCNLTVRLTKAPSVMILYLKRLGWNRKTAQTERNGSAVDFPIILDINPFLSSTSSSSSSTTSNNMINTNVSSSSNPSTRYRLYGLISHTPSRGNHPDFPGHYTAATIANAGNWHEFSDLDVSTAVPFPLPATYGTTVVGLFYHRE